jgi:hypothetical protein
MSISDRPMRPKDLSECVGIVAAHSILSSRYGDSIKQLHASWLRLLHASGFRAIVFEERDGSDVRLVGFDVSVFVSDGFLHQLKTAPFRWIGRELVSGVTAGDLPLLSNRQLREANSTSGLNVIGWLGCVPCEHVTRVEVLNTILANFVQRHHGFNLKEIIGQADSAETVESMLNWGAFFLDPKTGDYVCSPAKNRSSIFMRPHILGVTRELALRHAGRWVSSMFSYRRPQIYFTPGEQRLLQSAFDGRTDVELSDMLCISLSAVKKSWISIYKRVATCQPTLLPNRTIDLEPSGRGRERKQKLLAYLRQHPEELRPTLRNGGHRMRSRIEIPPGDRRKSRASPSPTSPGQWTARI